MLPTPPQGPAAGGCPHTRAGALGGRARSSPRKVGRAGRDGGRAELRQGRAGSAARALTERSSSCRTQRSAFRGMGGRPGSGARRLRPARARPTPLSRQPGRVRPAAAAPPSAGAASPRCRPCLAPCPPRRHRAAVRRGRAGSHSGRVPFPCGPSALLRASCPHRVKSLRSAARGQTPLSQLDYGTSSLSLNISRHCSSTAAVGCPFRCLIILSGKKLFRISNLSVPWRSLRVSSCPVAILIPQLFLILLLSPFLTLPAEACGPAGGLLGCTKSDK